MDKRFETPSSPFTHCGASTQRIMLDVIIALLPATAAAIVIFGAPALVPILSCVSAAVVSEFLFNAITHRKQSIGDLQRRCDGSAAWSQSQHKRAGLAVCARQRVRHRVRQVSVRRSRPQLCEPRHHRARVHARLVHAGHGRRDAEGRGSRNEC